MKDINFELNKSLDLNISMVFETQTKFFLTPILSRYLNETNNFQPRRFYMDLMYNKDK